MNTKVIIGIVALVVIAGGVGIYASNNSKTEMVKDDAVMQKEGEAMMQAENDVMVKKEEGAMMDKGDAMVKDDSAMMVKAGSYEGYEASKVAMATATHDVVLFFRASWCPTCRALDADIKAHLKDIPASLTILDVNYDNSTELKKKYGVTYQHTFVQVDAKGNLIKKWTGSGTLASLVAEVK